MDPNCTPFFTYPIKKLWGIIGRDILIEIIDNSTTGLYFLLHFEHEEESEINTYYSVIVNDVYRHLLTCSCEGKRIGIIKQPSSEDDLDKRWQWRTDLTVRGLSEQEFNVAKSLVQKEA